MDYDYLDAALKSHILQEARFLPITWRDDLSLKDLHECLLNLADSGMVILNVSIGVEDNGAETAAKEIDTLNTLFRTVAQERPRLTFVIAAGNARADLKIWKGAPQGICSQNLPNAVCITTHTAKVSADQRASGTSVDPFLLNGSFSLDHPNISSGSLYYTSFAAPAFARVLIKNGFARQQLDVWNFSSSVLKLPKYYGRSGDRAGIELFVFENK